MAKWLSMLRDVGYGIHTANAIRLGLPVPRTAPYAGVRRAGRARATGPRLVSSAGRESQAPFRARDARGRR